MSTNMENLNIFLSEIINEKLKRIIISNKKKNSNIDSDTNISNLNTNIEKIKIRPVIIKEGFLYQASETVGKKEIHKNFDAKSIKDYIIMNLENNFKQCQIETVEKDASILISKSLKVTINVKKKKEVKEVDKDSLKHNRTKKYLIPEHTIVPFMQDLGVMTSEGKIVNQMYDKYRQINRFLEFIEDIVPRIENEDLKKEITIIDFGCGKSYLTFAMYYYLHIMKKLNVRIIGLDLKEDVIDKCNTLAKSYQYEKLEFLKGDIADYNGVSKVDMVVTLHACDTATDYALAKAYSWGAKVILSVPCCQHEVNAQIQNKLLNNIFSYGILKERMSALITDGLRAEILKSKGYEVSILEFIDMEHTPKNLLIRAVKSKKEKDYFKTEKEIKDVLEEFNLEITLQKLLS